MISTVNFMLCLFYNNKKGKSGYNNNLVNVPLSIKCFN